MPTRREPPGTPRAAPFSGPAGTARPATTSSTTSPATLRSATCNAATGRPPSARYRHRRALPVRGRRAYMEQAAMTAREIVETALGLLRTGYVFPRPGRAGRRGDRGQARRRRVRRHDEAALADL